jgi:hypothetical protein
MKGMRHETAGTRRHRREMRRARKPNTARIRSSRVVARTADARFEKAQ